MSDRSYEGEPVDLTYQHLSERSNGQTVGGTTDDDKGDVETDVWPSEVPPREELSDGYVAVIEAAADPTQEWQSLSELSREATPEMQDTYAANALRRYWPSRHQEIKRQSTESGEQSNSDGDEQTPWLSHAEVVDLRRELLNGSSISDISDEYPVARSTIRKYARGERTVDPDDPPAVTYNNDNGEYVPIEEHDAESEQTTLAEDAEDDAPQETATQPDPDRPPRNLATGADDGPNSSRLKTVLAAVAGFLVGWVIGR